MIEAKRTARNAREGEEQLRQYIAEISAKQKFPPFGFMTNGLHHFFWEVGLAHPRSIAGFFSLGTVIDAMIVTRIVVQFMGQIVGLMLLRKNAPGMPRPYRMWLYPVPAVIALLGWIFVFATTQVDVILFGIAVLALGFVAFLLWSWNTKRWPFGLVEAA